MEILKEREKTHGQFEVVSTVAQSLKGMRRALGHSTMTNVQNEAFDMIASKLGRILSGNPHEVDHWRDIAGYAQLVVNTLEKE